MVLQITITDPESETTYTDSRHKVQRVHIQRGDFADIFISIYRTGAGVTNDRFVRYLGNRYIRIRCSGADFTTYFANSALNTQGENPFTRAEEFLLTQDPDEVGYEGNCPFDYKNDATVI